ncbi:transmembrane and immunoglobulin domain-containing protein 2 isoform X2 [Salmo salar]|uniref:transmembrane and immunoglobulin domain-containing protein 2 isoform X2 n=1 Tax=Salmo salar TaxID=8030 RepID=UPI0006B6FE16|nr:transmembrane and immunoglobulin domain-containing protein 2 isoform X2 [Salmo salar]|eukprot:XP_014072379.1 PREDICTED: transmembrane and immunoglobulin domain-containing protein 2 isoform X2 [Salmo salar]
MTCGDRLRSPPLSHKMDIWIKVTLLLFLIGTLVKPRLSTVILDQPPRTVEVHLGSSLTLNCSFMPQTRVKVNWYFSPTGHSSCSSNTLLYSSTHSADKTVKLGAGGHESKESRKSWSRLILKDVTHNNSGWYFCHVSVEIPVLQQACSNGTQVNISDNQMKSTTYTPLMTVGAASAIPVTLLVLIWILLQRRRCKSRENPIYSNMPPPRSAIKQPSPHPGIQMDNQKIPSPLKHTRTPPTAHYSEHLRTPTPARANDRQLFRTPNPPRVHEGKHLTIPTPATAHDNKFSPKP